jgi:ribosome assembly protein 1
MGPVYNIISKRRGRIISEDIQTSTSIFSVIAHIPVSESVGFAAELKKKTSGDAIPQIFFDKWCVIKENAIEKDIDKQS